MVKKNRYKKIQNNFALILVCGEFYGELKHCGEEKEEDNRKFEKIKN